MEQPRKDAELLHGNSDHEIRYEAWVKEPDAAAIKLLEYC